MSDTKIKQLSEAAAAISKDIQAAVGGFSKDRKSAEIDEGKIYLEHAAKEGLTQEIIDQKENFDKTFLAGNIHATTVMAEEAVKADNSLKDETFEVSIKGSKSTQFTARVTPFKEGVMAGRDGQPDRPWVKKGGATGSIKTTTGSRGDLGAAIQHAETTFSELLKG
jgi:hypothetical protein